MNILVTGARAPIAADLVHCLIRLGHRVWTADSMLFPVGRFSPGSEAYLRLPSPRYDFAAFSNRLVELCREHSIELVIPTSEEVFWLAAVPLPQPCRGFYPSPEILHELHHKHRFALLAEKLGYGSGGNQLLSSRGNLMEWLSVAELDKSVLKPVYSRFASRTLISPTVEQVLSINPTEEFPWLAQKKAHGQEYCIYNIASDGKLLLHLAYQPRWRAGQGAGIYFVPVEDLSLRQLSMEFIAATRATGQICFDVIATASGLVALECNPRGTSGAHLAAQHPDHFARALLGEKISLPPTSPVMLALPMLMYHPGLLFSPSGRQAWHLAKDAMRNARIPFPAQTLATCELAFRAFCGGRNLLEQSTQDIEWNGERRGNHA